MWINPYDNYLEGGYKHIRSNFHTYAGQIDKCSINTIEDTLTLY